MECAAAYRGKLAFPSSPRKTAFGMRASPIGLCLRSPCGGHRMGASRCRDIACPIKANVSTGSLSAVRITRRSVFFGGGPLRKRAVRNPSHSTVRCLPKPFGGPLTAFASLYRDPEKSSACRQNRLQSSPRMALRQEAKPEPMGVAE